jgi:hypothetical protein
MVGIRRVMRGDPVPMRARGKAKTLGFLQIPQLGQGV